MSSVFVSQRVLCNNGWTDWDAVTDVDSRGPKQPCTS